MDGYGGKSDLWGSPKEERQYYEEEERKKRAELLRPERKNLQKLELIAQTNKRNEEKIKNWLDSESDNVSEILPALRCVDRLTYERYRQPIAVKANIRVFVLDAEAKRSKADVQESNNILIFEDSEPWPEPVDGSSLFNEVHETILRYVVMSSAYATTCTLWIFFTYGLNLFDANPRLLVSGPEKRCGKSTLLDIVAALVLKCLRASNATPAAIFRAVDRWHPTLIIDEADSFAKENDQLRGILNSGHTPGQAYVLRSEGDDYEPKQFSTWAPMAMAGIGRIWDTLEDRSIVIELKRKTPEEKVQRLRGGRIINELKPLRQKLDRWVQDNIGSLRDMEPELPETLDDRAADNWRPLIAVADAIGVGKKARDAAVELSVNRSDDESIRIKLLQDLWMLFDQSDRWHTEDLIRELSGIEESPWGDWKVGKPISPQRLAGLLKPFGIKAKQIWLDGRNKRGYEISQFEDTFTRYLPLKSARGARMPENSESAGDSKVLGEDDPSILKSSADPCKQRTLAPLASQTEDIGSEP